MRKYFVVFKIDGKLKNIKIQSRRGKCEKYAKIRIMFLQLNGLNGFLTILCR